MGKVGSKLPYPYISDKRCHGCLETYDKRLHQRHRDNRQTRRISFGQERSARYHTENIQDGRSSSLKGKDCHFQDALAFSDNC